MGNGEYAVSLIQSLWPYTKGAKGPSAHEWALIDRDVEAAGIDAGQIKAIIEEMKREDQYFRLNNLSKRLRALSGKNQAKGEASNWKQVQGDQWRARGDRLRRVWSEWEAGPERDPALHQKARVVFGNFGRMADTMLAMVWPHETPLDDRDLLKLAMHHVRAAPEPRRPNEYPPPPWQPLDVQVAEAGGIMVCDWLSFRGK